MNILLIHLIVTLIFEKLKNILFVGYIQKKASTVYKYMLLYTFAYMRIHVENKLIKIKLIIRYFKFQIYFLENNLYNILMCRFYFQ